MAVVSSEVHDVHRGNFFHKGKFTAPVVSMAFNKYITMSKIRARILCGMRNGDHVYFAEYLMRKNMRNVV